MYKHMVWLGLFLAGLPLITHSQTDSIISMQDWHYPYPVHRLSLNDSLEIAYIDEGRGDTTLVFIHGLGSYLKSWQKTIDSLSPYYRCVAIDLPGYGKSSKGDYPFTLQFFADSVHDFIERLGLDKVVIVGHSMGGQIAMRLVLDYPERYEQLILLAPAGFETFTAAEGQAIRSVYTAALIKAMPEAQIVKNFEINFHDMPADARFMIDDRLTMRQTIEYDRYCEMIPRCVAAMLQEPVFAELGRIRLPTLVLFGENDLLIPNRYLHPQLSPAQVGQQGIQQLPDSELALIARAGHFLQWEQPAAVNQAIMRFLRR